MHLRQVVNPTMFPLTVVAMFASGRMVAEAKVVDEWITFPVPQH